MNDGGVLTLSNMVPLIVVNSLLSLCLCGCCMLALGSSPAAPGCRSRFQLELPQNPKL